MQGTCYACSAQYKDEAGNWVPAAVKCLPYDDPVEQEQADREVAAMKAVKASPHTATLLCEKTHLVDGNPKKFIAMR